MKTIATVIGAPVATKIYRIIGMLFGVFSVLSLLASFVFFYYGFFDKGIFLVGYALLNGLFCYGLWKRQRWMVTLSLINFGGVVIIKTVGFFQEITAGVNFLVSAILVAVLAGFIFMTRSSLKGRHDMDIAVLVAYLIVLLPILLRSIGIV